MRFRPRGVSLDPRLAQPRRRPARSCADGLASGGRRSRRMSFTDVPAGKIAAIVTSLEMFARPPARPERSGNDFMLEHVVRPDLAWFRRLFRRVGENWIWVSRLKLPDDGLAAIIHDPAVEVWVLRSGAAEAGCSNWTSGTPTNAN